MRIKTTINDTNGTDISKKIYHSRLSNTQKQNCLTHSGTNLHSSVPASRIGSKPNNILFLILIDCLLLLSEKVTENISKCYPFFFSFPCSTTLLVKRVLQRIRVPKRKLYILELQNWSFET